MHVIVCICVCEFWDEILLRGEECEDPGKVKRYITITVQATSVGIYVDLG